MPPLPLTAVLSRPIAAFLCQDSPREQLKADGVRNLLLAANLVLLVLVCAAFKGCA